MVSKTQRERRDEPLSARGQLACAGASIFKEKGFDLVTMEDVAASAGVAGATLYSHFPVKEAIVVHWLHSQLQAAMPSLVKEAMTRPSFMARAATLLDASASWWEEHRALAAPYVRWRFQQVREDGDHRSTSEFVPVYERLVRHAQESGELSGARAPCELAAYLHFLSLGALLAWVASNEIPLAERYADALEFFMEGARANAGRRFFAPRVGGSAVSGPHWVTPDHAHDR